MIQKIFRMLKLRRRFLKVMSSAKLISRYYRGMRGRIAAKKRRVAKGAVISYYDTAWQTIWANVRDKSARLIQRWTRGLLCRLKNWDTVIAIRKAKAEFIIRKSAIRI